MRAHFFFPSRHDVRKSWNFYSFFFSFLLIYCLTIIISIFNYSAAAFSQSNRIANQRNKKKKRNKLMNGWNERMKKNLLLFFVWFRYLYSNSLLASFLITIYSITSISYAFLLFSFFLFNISIVWKYAIEMIIFKSLL